jgi:hypothetical protein
MFHKKAGVREQQGGKSYKLVRSQEQRHGSRIATLRMYTGGNGSGHGEIERSAFASKATVVTGLAEYI